MEFRILGPLEILDDSVRLPMGGGRERALLALLLLSANRVVSTERLTDDLWGDRPPEGAAHALQVYVSRLRKVFREAGRDDVLVTRSPGYLIRVEPGALDAARFDDLLAQGREQAAGGDHAGAAAALCQALALWRGPALADVADAPSARAEAHRLEEARLAALEERVEADLACGRHAELVVELDALTRAHPLRERLWAGRMLALYRSGRQADALRAYQELRGILGEELGLEPSVAVARLEGAILRHDLQLDWPPGEPTTPSPPTRKTASAPAGVVTFLFTDLVGSTELIERLGDDNADELRRTHFALLRRAISDAGGNEVKNLGDGLMVAFSSPLAALQCAVAMQEVMAEHSRSHPHRSLRVRMGLHAGEPVRDEDDFFGTPVVVAKRLCDRAQGGQIVASELVAGLIGSRGGFRFASLGRLALKGLAAPVPAVAVAWQAPEGDEPELKLEVPRKESRPPIPVPGLLSGTGRGFVGRDAELERLQQLWKEASAGQLRLALVAGEPGVGKTRLAAEFARRLHAQGASVLAGACEEDLGVPYQPFVEALRHLLQHATADELADCLGRYPGELARLVPELAERLPGLPPPLSSDPETERYRLFDAVAAWLAGVSRHHPLLLVLDDLQWAAKPTLLLLRHIARSAEPMHLLMVCTYRDTEIRRGDPLTEALADLRRWAGIWRLSLSGLDQTEVVAFLEEAAGHALEDESDLALARAIHTETEGNPFFVGEVLRHLTETGGVEYRAGRWVAAAPVEKLGIPEGVRDVVSRRLSRLSDDNNHVLACASVIGLEFDPAVLRASGAFSEDVLLSALDEAVRARLVVDMPGAAPRYRFAHALVRATLYDELTGARRVVHHRRIAEAIEAVHAGALDDHLPALAHHWRRASPAAAETGRAIEYARRAGDRALSQLAHDEAVSYYRQALEMLPVAQGSIAEKQRLEVLLALGEAQRRAGDPAYRRTLLDAGELAMVQADADALARAALANSRAPLWSTSGLVDAERVKVIEAALEMVGQNDSDVRARLLATLALELTFGPDREQRVRYSDEALAIARRLDHPSTRAAVLVPRNAAIWGPDNLGERLANVEELERAAELVGDPVIGCVAWSLRYRCLMEGGEVVEADHSLERFARCAGELGQPTLAWQARFFRAGRLLFAARLDEAERLARETLDLGLTSGQQDARLIFLFEQFLLAYDRGRLDDLESDLAEGADSYNRLPALQAMVALAYCEAGRDSQARATFEQLADQGFDVSVNVAWFVATTVAAQVAAHLGDSARAEVLYDLLRPYPHRLAFLASAIFGSVAHHLGVLATAIGRLDEAEDYFVAAEAVHEQAGAPTWLARTRLEWARMLLSRAHDADRERAAQLLAPALATARQQRLPKLERQAAGLLSECR